MKTIDIIIVLIIALLVIVLVMLIFFPKIKHTDVLSEEFVEKTLEEQTAAEIDPEIMAGITAVSGFDGLILVPDPV